MNLIYKYTGKHLESPFQISKSPLPVWIINNFRFCPNFSELLARTPHLPGCEVGVGDEPVFKKCHFRGFIQKVSKWAVLQKSDNFLKGPGDIFEDFKIHLF